MSYYINPPRELSIELKKVLDIKQLNKNDFRYIYTNCNNLKEFESIPGFIERALSTGLFKDRRKPQRLNVLRNPFKRLKTSILPRVLN
jgi:hypothetical protein